VTDLRAAYQERISILGTIAQRLEEQLRDYFRTEERVDRISARPKSLDRFLKKAEATIGDRSKYDDPMHQIQVKLGLVLLHSTSLILIEWSRP
jgi:chromosome segregation ATPase